MGIKCQKDNKMLSQSYTLHAYFVRLIEIVIDVARTSCLCAKCLLYQTKPYCLS